MTLFNSCPRYTQCVECSLVSSVFYKWTDRQDSQMNGWLCGTVVAKSLVWLVSWCYHQIYCIAVGVCPLHLLYAKTFLWELKSLKYLLTTASSLECCDHVTCGCILSLHFWLYNLHWCLATSRVVIFVLVFATCTLFRSILFTKLQVLTKHGNDYHKYHFIENI